MSAERFDIVVVGATQAAEALVIEARRRAAKVAWIRCFPEARADEFLWRDLIDRSKVLRFALVESELSRDLRARVSRAIWRDALRLRERYHAASAESRVTRDEGLTIWDGPPRFATPTRLDLESGERVESEAFVVATGVSPRRPSRLFGDDRIVRDHRSMLRCAAPPRTVAIIGADWLGCEWSAVCAAAGAEVTLIDRRSRLLRALDSDLRTSLQGRLHRMGVDIVLEEEIVEIRAGRFGECRVRLSSGREELVERCLVLAGQTGNSSGLGLKEIGVQTDALGHIATDEWFRSSVTSIFAVGSVADPLGIGPSSAFQARVLMDSVLEGPGEPPMAPLPWVLRSAIEIASCGLTAEACGALDVDVIVGKSSSREWDPTCSRLAKVIVERGSGRLLGAQIAGIGATEAIGQACDGLARERTVEDCVSDSCVESTATETYHQALDAALREWQAARRMRPALRLR